MTLKEKNARRAQLRALYLDPETIEETLNREFPPEQQEEQIQEIAETGGERSETEQLAYENELHRKKILDLLESRVNDQNEERDAEMRSYFTKAVDLNFATMEMVGNWIKEIYVQDSGSIIILIKKESNGKMTFTKNPETVRLVRPEDQKRIEECKNQDEK